MKQSKLKNGIRNSIILFALACFSITQAQNTKKPNILIIWGDDIATTNVNNFIF
ncbi:hypothetical protein FLA105534_02472 [Flavobacterium bizetiae]|uniref:Sulfatase N-terminal domain-containing protein n=1 Tax=Flavobacterium bizetiae TaxID=2704140 RepID=A0A6J4GIY6_9FLAO|nr:hypothetical protein [Flavobacterium bizetiae]CAA9199148.1 hypothetical protein FLA105534_02472 [Flavobacterium bizetiae]CAD5342073.1 hypothetical protein FLA105535_02054 [Flavobacterium bizetiae]CAD5349148.1 hypothetical protein FLA105534_03132 [Flavobacterium bizetiae]